MISFFYQIQLFFDKHSNGILKKITYRVIQQIIRLIAPTYYRIVNPSRIGIEINSKRKEKVIISLTSFPERMNQISLVLESLLRQTVKPDKIILWLSTSQFPTIKDVNIIVRNFQKRGLDIRFCDDLRSHKKYFYTMQEFPEDLVITVDDDIFYTERMVEELLKKHREHPGCIVCYRAHKISVTDGKIDKYEKWSTGSKNILGPDKLLMPTGSGGVLYPPGVLNKQVFEKETIKKICFFADDIWLKCMSFLNGTYVVKVHKMFPELFTVKNSNKTGLAKFNVEQAMNDEQIINVIQHYNILFMSKNL